MLIHYLVKSIIYYTIVINLIEYKTYINVNEKVHTDALYYIAEIIL